MINSLLFFYILILFMPRISQIVENFEQLSSWADFMMNQVFLFTNHKKFYEVSPI